VWLYLGSTKFTFLPVLQLSRPRSCNYVDFEVLAVGIMKGTVFWFVAPCRLERTQYFKGTYWCVPLKCQAACELLSNTAQKPVLLKILWSLSQFLYGDPRTISWYSVPQSLPSSSLWIWEQSFRHLVELLVCGINRKMQRTCLKWFIAKLNILYSIFLWCILYAHT
jgi:hypothetical protein